MAGDAELGEMVRCLLLRVEAARVAATIFQEPVMASLARSIEVPPGPSPRPSRAPHLLVAEDDDDFRHVLRTILERQGFEVTDVPDGRAALSILASEDARTIDGAVLDVRMPGATGLEVLRARRLANDPIPVILISGFADGLGVLSTDYEAEVVSKPFDIGELLDAVMRSLARRTPRPSSSFPVRNAESSEAR
jgi:DNA-binding response OmpR family regulator